MVTDLVYEQRITNLTKLAEDQQAHIDQLTAAANEVLRVYMPQFPDSRAVDDCLVGLASAVAKPIRGFSDAKPGDGK